MSTPVPTAESGRTTTSTRPVRTGVARTLARGRLAPRRPTDPGVTSAPTTGSPTGQMSQDFNAPSQPLRPVSSASGDAIGIRRSQTQMAAILARAVAQGQRNL
jgi:hypothetical protein